MLKPVDMTGPWEAVAVDPTGFVLDPYDDADNMIECDAVTVVRRSAAPTPAFDDSPRLPEQYKAADVLYRISDLLDNPETVPVVLAQAIATAEALNRAAA